MKLSEGCFCFIENQFFIDFPDEKLMKNKTETNEFLNGRPFFFSFRDEKNTDIIWFIPISSKVNKYERIFQKKMNKYNQCFTIQFADVLETKKVFLIQNMFPSIEKYIQEIYTDSKTSSVISIDSEIEDQIIKLSKKVLRMHKHNVHIIFPNVLEIERKLIEELQRNKHEDLN